jgi:uncharacterized surface protein with fasciclin (FAS1) repeats
LTPSDDMICGIQHSLSHNTLRKAPHKKAVGKGAAFAALCYAPYFSRILTVVLSLGLLITLAVSATAMNHGKAKMDIVDTAASDGSFETLVAAVKAADLVDTLKGDGPFTVFAPTDEAFAKLPAGTIDNLLKPENKSKLQAIRTYHVVPGKVMASDVTQIDSAKTVYGGSLPIKTGGGSVMIGDAKVTKADIQTSNGVIHVIDTVLLPN